MNIGDTVKSKVTGKLYKVIEQKENRQGYVCESADDDKKYYFFEDEVEVVSEEEMTKVKTPTLDRMLEIREQSQLCGEFLDWFLQRYTVFDRNRSRESDSLFMNVLGNSDYIDKEKLLADFFGIDLNEAEREKEMILKSLNYK